MQEMKKKMLSTVLVALMTVGIFMAVPMSVTRNAEAAGAVATVAIPGSYDVDVQPGAPGVVVMPGEVSVDHLMEGVQTIVSLRASSSIGSAVTISPSTLIFSRGTSSTQSITITVKVQTGTSQTATDVIMVDGTITEGTPATSPVNPGSAQIIVRQYYRITVSSESPYIETSPGKQVFFNMRLENNGNGEDTFFIYVKDDIHEALTKEGWTVQIGNPKPVVEEKEHRVVAITATTPQKTTVWKNEITRLVVSVESENARSLGFAVVEEYTLYVRQRGFHVPGFDPSFAIIALAFVGAAFMRKKNMENCQEEE